mmetsp:Transcript_21087/g.67213  ORF Transcript_21087/g.67213 Transcript_21087/m.67213 type:complete len:251 (+) Transcript_21087:524-1276(+)
MLEMLCAGSGETEALARSAMVSDENTSTSERELEINRRATCTASTRARSKIFGSVVAELNAICAVSAPWMRTWEGSRPQTNMAPPKDCPTRPAGQPQGWLPPLPPTQALRCRTHRSTRREPPPMQQTAPPAAAPPPPADPEDAPASPPSPPPNPARPGLPVPSKPPSVLPPAPPPPPPQAPRPPSEPRPPFEPPPPPPAAPVNCATKHFESWAAAGASRGRALALLARSRLSSMQQQPLSLQWAPVLAAP